jgi:hypothetical protein
MLMPTDEAQDFLPFFCIRSAHTTTRRPAMMCVGCSLEPFLLSSIVRQPAKTGDHARAVQAGLASMAPEMACYSCGVLAVNATKTCRKMTHDLFATGDPPELGVQATGTRNEQIEAAILPHCAVKPRRSGPGYKARGVIELPHATHLSTPSEG